MYNCTNYNYFLLYCLQFIKVKVKNVKLDIQKNTKYNFKAVNYLTSLLSENKNLKGYVFNLLILPITYFTRILNNNSKVNQYKS